MRPGRSIYSTNQQQTLIDIKASETLLIPWLELMVSPTGNHYRRDLKGILRNFMDI